MKNIVLGICSFLLIALSPSLAVSDPENRGVSWILQMCAEASDCNVIKQSYKDASVINAGWLYLTSNPNRCKCAAQLLQDPRPARIRVDICNSTCFPERGRRCEKQECFAGMNTQQANKAIITKDPATYARINKAIAMAKADIKAAKNLQYVAIKPCLECSIDPKARYVLNDYVKSKMADIPGAFFVDNPLNDKCTPGMKCERHGDVNMTVDGIADLDGLDYDRINQYSYLKRNNDADMVLGWKICNNGLKKDEPYKPGVLRTNYCGLQRESKDFATITKQNTLDITSEVKEVDKKGCNKFFDYAKPASKGFVLKLGDGRNFAVFLSPYSMSSKAFKRVEIRKDGQVIDAACKNPALRCGKTYDHDTSSVKRKIYDFSNHPASDKDNSILFADGSCWVLPKPQFRVQTLKG